ncbi:MAG TPA: hypothetical protein VFI84_04035 [Candidatus Saccharimonadales bacterium]|nr:hypothetical protein [Candidatus Saccharimonadales bacterium]
MRMPKQNIILGFAAFAAIFGAFLAHTPSANAATYTSADINCGATATDTQHCLRLGIQSALNWDTACQNYLNAYYPSSWDLRSVINGVPGGGGASYADETWLSKQGYSRYDTPLPINYGSKSYNLQINAVTFLCGSLIWSDNGWGGSPAKGNSAIGTILGQSQRWVPSNTNADDRNANAVGGGNLLPARLETSNQINNITVTGGCPSGSTCTITGYTKGEIRKIVRNGSSRYWFMSPDAITFNSTQPITHDLNLTITMDYKFIDGYEGPVYRCDGGSSYITVTSDTAFGKCVSQTRNLKITLTVVNIPDNRPNITIASVTQPSCTSAGNIYGAAWDPDDWYPATASNQMTVVVHMDSPSGASTSVIANAYEFTDSSGRVHAHGFNFDPTSIAGYTKSSPHTFYFDTSGVSNVNGDPSALAATEQSTTLNAVSGDCYPPSGTITSAACTQILGNAIDNDSPNTSLTITFYLNSTSGPSATATTDASHNFSFNPQASFSAYFPSFSPHSIYAYVKGVDTSGNPAGSPVQLANSPVSIYCPPVVSCSSVTPAINEADSPAKITAIFSYTAADGVPPTNPPYSITVSVSPSGGSGSGLDSATSNTATYTYTTPNLPAGTYTATATFNGPGGFTTASCPPTNFIAYNLPYYKVYGNDVKAGGAFDAGSCANQGTSIGNIGFLGGFLPSPDGYGIKGFDNTANTGAGAQFAAYAIGHIASFNSAMMRAAVGGNPGPTKGLTFANSGGTYGGDVGGTNCIHNYYNDISQLGTSIPLGASADPATLNGSYTHTGNLTLNSSTVVPKGSRTIIYVTSGNVYIGAGSGGIKYDTSTWNSLSDIPSLWVVVNGGNIFIDPGVTQLDGVYVAQPTTTNTMGKIFTCANNGFGAPDLSSINGTAGDSCNNQLTVNGAFIAQGVELLRSYSSLRFSQAGEFPYGSSSNCAGLATCAAEVFNFSPEVFMAPPNGLGNSGGSKYDYITELPPVL